MKSKHLVYILVFSILFSSYKCRPEQVRAALTVTKNVISPIWGHFQKSKSYFKIPVNISYTLNKSSVTYFNRNQTEIDNLTLKEYQKRLSVILLAFASFNKMKAASDKNVHDNFEEFLRNSKDINYDPSTQRLSIIITPNDDFGWPKELLNEKNTEIVVSIPSAEILKNLPNKIIRSQKEEEFFEITPHNPGVESSPPPPVIPPPVLQPPSAHSVESVIALLKQKYGNSLQQNNDGDFEINTGTDPGKPVPVTMVKMKKGKVWKVKTDPTERKFKYEDKNLDGTFDSF